MSVKLMLARETRRNPCVPSGVLELLGRCCLQEVFLIVTSLFGILERNIVSRELKVTCILAIDVLLCLLQTFQTRANAISVISQLAAYFRQRNGSVVSLLAVSFLFPL